MLDAIPDELRLRDQWVLWRGDEKIDAKTGEVRLNKIPYTVRLRKASSTDPRTWTSYARVTQVLSLALEEWREESHAFRQGGIGFVFTAEDPYLGIDLDHCRDPGTGGIEPWAIDYIQRLDTYTEVSPSGTGVHCIGRGQHPGARKRKGRVEVYAAGRFFTMTGNMLGVGREIADCTDTLAAIYTELFPAKAEPAPKAARAPKPLDTAEIFRKASSARNGGKFRVLWSGDISGYASASEADAAFCAMLAFWTQDPAQIDALYRDSGLCRDKWDTRRGDSTYGAQTIAHALAQTTTMYRDKDSSSPSTTILTPTSNGHAPPHEVFVSPQDWHKSLLFSSTGELRECISNTLLILKHHAAWHKRLWFDVVRALPMLDAEPLSDEAVTYAAAWLGTAMKLGIHNLGNLERCLITVAKETPRDLLREWLEALPPWDGTERLVYWLSDVCEVPRSAYATALSRILPLSMVARALDPGCLYRYVVILEGPENTGKSSLVRTLAGPEWYVELSVGLENKEAHMLLQGAWVAEFAELDSLNRTEETRLKSFITMRQDAWIPKYANFRVTVPRRTVFVGTTNEESYLKGQTGNTRFLPLKTAYCNCELLEALRPQLFAEALRLYRAAPDTWWQLDAEALHDADDERAQRRVRSVYEDDLAEYLSMRSQVTWQDIAKQYLNLEKARWADKSLQAQITQALKALGWTLSTQKVRLDDGTRSRPWVAPVPG